MLHREPRARRPTRSVGSGGPAQGYPLRRMPVGESSGHPTAPPARLRATLSPPAPLLAEEALQLHGPLGACVRHPRAERRVLLEGRDSCRWPLAVRRTYETGQAEGARRHPRPPRPRHQGSRASLPGLLRFVASVQEGLRRVRQHDGEERGPARRQGRGTTPSDLGVSDPPLDHPAAERGGVRART